MDSSLCEATISVAKKMIGPWIWGVRPVGWSYPMFIEYNGKTYMFVGDKECTSAEYFAFNFTLGNKNAKRQRKYYFNKWLKSGKIIEV